MFNFLFYCYIIFKIYCIDDYSFLTLGELKAKEAYNNINNTINHKINTDNKDSSLLELYNREYNNDDNGDVDIIKITHNINNKHYNRSSSNTYILAEDNVVNNNDNNKIGLDIIICYIPKGSSYMSRRMCNNNVNNYIAPDNELSCSKKMSPSNIIDFISGNQPIQKLGSTLDFSNENKLRYSLNNINKDTRLHLLFGDCKDDYNGIPDIDEYKDYIGMIIMNNNNERDGIDIRDQHATIGTLSIISYKTVMLFYPLEYFFKALSNDIINRRKSDVVNTLMNMNKCYNTPTNCIYQMSEAGKRIEGEDGATLATGYVSILNSNNITKRRNQDKPGGSSLLEYEAWEQQHLHHLHYTRYNNNDDVDKISSSTTSTTNLRLTNTLYNNNEGSNNNDGVGDDTDSDILYTLCYIPKGHVMISRNICLSSLENNKRKGWELYAPSIKLTCSKPLTSSYIINNNIYNNKDNILNSTTRIRLLYDTCDNIRSLPDLSLDKDYIALILLNDKLLLKQQEQEEGYHSLIRRRTKDITGMDEHNYNNYPVTISYRTISIFTPISMEYNVYNNIIKTYIRDINTCLINVYNNNCINNIITKSKYNTISSSSLISNDNNRVVLNTGYVTRNIHDINNI